MQGPPPLVILLVVLASIIFSLAAGAAILKLVRAYEKWASRLLTRHYEGIELHTEMQPGDVILNYHTYHGLLVWHTETPHRAMLPIEDARRLLGRLFRHNLRWGWLAEAGILVIPLAICNYLAQRRSIARQEAAQASPQFWSRAIDAGQRPDHGYGTPLSTATASAVAEPRSNVRRALGWVTGGLAVIFAAVAIAGLALAQLREAIGALVVAVLLGAVAHDWIRGRQIE
ncbi:MAG TPA: hypothetical protein VFI31_10795 [Pirellulales bacterium]|nr:hypothetical protein [Pirellulales bacterium]